MYFSSDDLMKAGFDEQPDKGRLHFRDTKGKLHVIFPKIFFCDFLTPTVVVEPTATNTPEATATEIVEPTPTETLTPEPTATEIEEPTPTETLTPEPTATEIEEPTPTETVEPTVTNTPEPTATEIVEPTATLTPEATATEIVEPTPTETVEPTPTNTPEPTATSTPEPTVTPTLSPDTDAVLLVPDAGPFAVGDLFIARLILNLSEEELCSYNVRIAYDPAVFELVAPATAGADASGVLTGPNISVISPGVFRVSGALIGGATPPTGQIELALLTFRVLSAPSNAEILTLDSAIITGGPTCDAISVVLISGIVLLFEEPGPTPVEPTATPTETVEPTATATEIEEPTPTETLTPEPTATEIEEPTPTETVEPTVTNTPEPTATEIVEPTATLTPEATATEIVEPTPTETVEPTATWTPEPTATEIVEPTPTETVEPTATEIEEPTPTETLTPEPTATEIVEPTPTETVEATATPTTTPTVTAEPTVEPTVIPTKKVVDVDVKPGECPNVVWVNRAGDLKIAILGSADFDVTQIDPYTVRAEGLAPYWHAYEDVATPFGGELDSCEACTTDGPDGYIDLVLKFDNFLFALVLLTDHSQYIVGPKCCILVKVTGKLRDDDGEDDDDDNSKFVGYDTLQLQFDRQAFLDWLRGHKW